jgi:hypothetical protein
MWKSSAGTVFGILKLLPDLGESGLKVLGNTRNTAQEYGDCSLREKQHGTRLTKPFVEAN